MKVEVKVDNQAQKKNFKDKKSKAKAEEGFWQEPIKYIKGVGDYWAKRLKSLGIEEVKDLLYYFQGITMIGANVRR